MAKRKKIIYGWLNSIVVCCFVLAGQFVSAAFGLKGLKIFVPEAVIVKNAVTLSCEYDLEQASLYSVKWYFESEEFYRYVPKEAPPAMTFPLTGVQINVDLQQSDTNSVTLKDVTRDLSGLYQCEVSEDAPLFHTDIRAAKMQVVELPTENPRLQVEKRYLTPHDNLRAVCTVGSSFPPANISWFVNGRRIAKSPYQRITHQSHQGAGATSSLEMYTLSPILRDLFQSAATFQTSLIVLCEVSIFHIYNRDALERIFIGDPSVTVSPNMLNWEGAAVHPRRNNGGTGGGDSKSGVTQIYLPAAFLSIVVVLLPIVLFV